MDTQIIGFFLAIGSLVAVYFIVKHLDRDNPNSSEVSRKRNGEMGERSSSRRQP